MALELNTDPNSTSRQRRLKCFLCHSSSDKSAVRILYELLRVEGAEPWLDERSLLPGQEWEPAIRKAIRTTDVVIVCLSPKAVTKAGYVQKEIREALDVADQQPEEAIFIIPVKVEACTLPARLNRWQAIGLRDKNGYGQLVKALTARAQSVGATFGRIHDAENVATLFDPDKLRESGIPERAIQMGDIARLHFSGNFKEAEVALKLRRDQDPKDYEYLYFVVQDLGENYGKYDDVIRIVEGSLDAVRKDAPLWAGRLLKCSGLAFYRRWFRKNRDPNDLVNANRDLLESIRLSPALAEAHLHLALISAYGGDLASCDSHLANAVERCADPAMMVATQQMRSMLRHDPVRFLDLMKRPPGL
ncbi:MAG TPA: toll/interleukin-1 receptor domain-containing protein [Bryobacteraceae bacterium]